MVRKRALVKEKGQEKRGRVNKELAQSLLETLTPAYALDKKMKIGIAYDIGLRVQDIAELVETSEKYVRNVTVEIKNSPKLRARFAEIVAQMPDWYRSTCRSRLPMLAEAEAAALTKYLENPDLLIERPQLAKQIKAAAGVKTGDEFVAPQRIDIESLQILVAQGVPNLAPRPAITVESEDEAKS